MAEAIVDIQELAQAIKTAVEETAPIKQVHISRYKAKTAFNPTGDKKNRPKLNCTLFQNGGRINPSKLFAREIELVNQVKPGRYLDRKVEIVERIENGEKSIDIRYSNSSVQQRMELKNVFRNLTELLEKVIAEQK